MSMDQENKNLVSLAAILFLLVIIHQGVSGGNDTVLREKNKITVTQGEKRLNTALLAASNDSLLTTRIPVLEVSAHAYSVRIMGEEEPLVAQRKWKKLPPASLTKLFTALLAAQTLTDDDLIFLSESSKRAEYSDAKMSIIPAGVSLKRDDAISVALMESANDVAHALAESIQYSAGDKNQAMTFENITEEKLKSLGLSDTHFVNPTGLDAPEHYTTAEDLSRLAEYIWNTNSNIWSLSRQVETEVEATNGFRYAIKNTNDLLKEFPAILGSKTGFTERARGSLLLLYPVNVRHIAIIVILHSENRFEDGRKIIHWLEETFAS